MVAVKTPLFRSHFGYDTKAASVDASVVPEGESLTVQSMAEDADINVLMRRYGITGKMPENPRVPMYGDFEHITDFQSAIDAVRGAEAAFGEFPAEVRARFQNSPQALLEFCANGANREEAIKLGLIKPPVVAEPPVVPPAPQPQAAAPPVAPTV